ncbi:MAG TPA: hypothetical protein VJV79_02845 [Polyangiaceae bacterium]|nr:hypothetical protein [Polyangiaceae bacterium]
MNAALKLVEQSPLQVQVDAARAHIVDLAQDVDQKRFNLDKAETKYRASREPMDRLERDCAKDRLQDAENALAAQREAYAPLFAEADREVKVAELGTLAAQLSATEFTRHRERLDEIFAATRRDMRGALTDLLESVVRSNRLRARARNLAEVLGLPAGDYPTIVFESLLEVFVPRSPYGETETFSLTCFMPNFQESQRRWRLEFNELLNGGSK